jgi:hypothetical protein
MADFVSTEQYLWGLRRVLDGITARTASTPGRLGRKRADGAGESVVEQAP